MLTKKNLLWSKGYLDDDYSRVATETPSDEDTIINIMKTSGDVIFIRTGSGKRICDVDHFANNLDKLSKPCILITLDGDRDIPSSYDKSVYEKILNNSNIKILYTQNYDKKVIHPKLKHYPIGFDLHTGKWLINNSIQEKIDFMVKCREYSPVNHRISNKIFSDTHNSKTHGVRSEIYEIIKNNNIFEKSTGRHSFVDITKEYNKYNFALSPRGRGLDCHRTWELFLAGVIVITKTSTLDEMYTNNNLPVVILQDYEELKDITEDTLQKWYKTHKDKTDVNNIFPRLKYDYWIKNV